MGWTGIDGRYIKTATDRKEFCDDRFNYEDERHKWKVLRSAMRGTTYYAAVEMSDKETKASFVRGVVVKTAKTKAHGYDEFLYKELIEDMGPVEDRCPKSIISLLSPTDNEYASDWRNRCLSRYRK